MDPYCTITFLATRDGTVAYRLVLARIPGKTLKILALIRNGSTFSHKIRDFLGLEVLEELEIDDDHLEVELGGESMHRPLINIVCPTIRKVTILYG
jgi:hypothetical protein